MSEPFQILVGLVCLASVFLLTRYIIGWQVKCATGRIIRDLQKQNAFDSVSAIELPYATQDPWHIGTRNYPAIALQFLTNEGTVVKTESGRYYLRQNIREPSIGTVVASQPSSAYGHRWFNNSLRE